MNTSQYTPTGSSIKDLIDAIFARLSYNTIKINILYLINNKKRKMPVSKQEFAVLTELNSTLTITETEVKLAYWNDVKFNKHIFRCSSLVQPFDHFEMPTKDLNSTANTANLTANNETFEDIPTVVIRS